MTADIHVDTFRWTDIPDAVAIEHVSFTDGKWSVETFWRELAEPTRSLFAARQRDRLVGYADVDVSSGHAQLFTIAVSPEGRRQGVAAALVRHALAQLDANDIGDLWLEVSEHNQAARGLYVSLGFEQVDVRRDYYRAGDSALVMRRSIMDGG